MQETFTSKEVVALTGISPRQLQWWDERHIVVPTREGHKRIYGLDDLAEVAVDALKKLDGEARGEDELVETAVSRAIKKASQRIWERRPIVETTVLRV